MRIFSSQRPSLSSGRDSTKFLLVALVSLVVFWLICFFTLATKWHPTFDGETIVKVPLKHERHLRIDSLSNGKNLIQPKEERVLEPILLSRTGHVVATSDVRGNLGPASVVVQPHPGDDWIHDRWQAASNMHGKNIPGSHWILLEFEHEVMVDKIVLDWEAAYADQYRVEGFLEKPNDVSESGKEIIPPNAHILFDGTDPTQEGSRSITKIGQSPGVKTKTPLHVVHTLHPLQPISRTQPVKFLRLHIFKSAMGWGVSLWQFDVYGYYKSDVFL